MPLSNINLIKQRYQVMRDELLQVISEREFVINTSSFSRRERRRQFHELELNYNNRLIEINRQERDELNNLTNDNDWLVPQSPLGPVNVSSYAVNAESNLPSAAVRTNVINEMNETLNSYRQQIMAYDANQTVTLSDSAQSATQVLFNEGVWAAPEYNVWGDRVITKPVIKNKEQQMKVLKIKEELSKATAETFHRLIRCGFELETQESNGLDADNRPVNEEAYESSIARQASYLIKDPYFLKNHFNFNMKTHPELYNKNGEPSLKKILKTLNEEQLVAAADRANEVAREETARCDFMLEPCNSFDIKLSEVGLDGSVKGFEFRTKGAKTMAEFKEAAKEVFKLKHEIDEKCSFHIHISVEGITHNYGGDLQLLLMEGILRQAAKLPASVLNRWREGFNNYDDIGHFFRWEVDNDKYIAVSKHNRYNTWEFRCFGNVQNYKDAMKCLNIAVNAMRYAYKRQLLKARTEILTDNNVNEIAEKIANLTSWQAILTEYAEEQESAA